MDCLCETKFSVAQAALKGYVAEVEDSSCLHLSRFTHQDFLGFFPRAFPFTLGLSATPVYPFPRPLPLISDHCHPS